MSQHIRYMIQDDRGVIWSSDSPDAQEEGAALMAAAERGDTGAYAEALGTAWAGDLVFVQEISRTR